jgi:hypothetical protein
MIEGHDYTIYSNGPAGRARMYTFLALITAFLTPLAQHGGLVLLRRYWGDDWDVAQTALFFGGFTALILFGLLTNLFDGYLWRTHLGAWMFRLTGASAPPDLNGEYRGTIEVSSVTEGKVFRGEYVMRISQTWEQISLQFERQGETDRLVRLHSDMASIRIGMLVGVSMLRFVYTFEESLPRREGVGTMARQFAGTATLEFRRDGDAWQVTGHFFDDIGRSGQINLRQGLAGFGAQTAGGPFAKAASSEQPEG